MRLCVVLEEQELFAWEQEDFVPDITTSGKALGGGYSPLSAVFMNQKVVDVLLNGSASFNNGHIPMLPIIMCSWHCGTKNYTKR